MHKGLSLKSVTTVGSPIADGNPFPLNGVAEGAAPYERIGREITPVSLDVRSHVRAFWNTFPGYGFYPLVQVVRSVLVYDRYPTTASLPYWSDIFQDVGWTGSSASSPLSFINESNSDRFEIVKDKIFYFDPPEGPPDGSAYAPFIEKVQPWNFKVDLSSYPPQTFRAGTGDPGAVASGLFYLFAYSTYYSPGILTADATFRVRYSYFDK